MFPFYSVEQSVICSMLDSGLSLNTFERRLKAYLF